MGRKTKPKKADQNPRQRSSSSGSSVVGKPFWNGSITFGLVNIPIQLYSAVREKGVRFHMLHEKDQARVKEKLVCSVENKEVPRDQLVKGYEVGPDQNVVVEAEELRALAPKETRSIELSNFVQLEDIDPLYFDRPFYLLPKESAAKPYRLLLEALKQSGKVGVGKFVMRNKEYIGAIRPIKSVLFLETMHFEDEVVHEGQLLSAIPEVSMNPSEIKMAVQLVNSMSEKFDSHKLHDNYREALLELIRKKADGQELPHVAVKEERQPEVIDLMAALQKSLEATKKQRSRAA